MAARRSDAHMATSSLSEGLPKTPECDHVPEGALYTKRNVYVVHVDSRVVSSKLGVAVMVCARPWQKNQLRGLERLLRTAVRDGAPLEDLLGDDLEALSAAVWLNVDVWQWSVHDQQLRTLQSCPRASPCRW